MVGLVVVGIAVVGAWVVGTTVVGSGVGTGVGSTRVMRTQKNGKGLAHGTNAPLPPQRWTTPIGDQARHSNGSSPIAASA